MGGGDLFARDYGTEDHSGVTCPFSVCPVSKRYEGEKIFCVRPYVQESTVWIPALSAVGAGFAIGLAAIGSGVGQVRQRHHEGGVRRGRIVSSARLVQPNQGHVHEPSSR